MSESKSHSSSLSRSRVERWTMLIGGVTGMRSTGKFLRRQLWIWPIVAAVAFGGAGWWVHLSVEQAMKHNRVSSLTTLVDADVAALRAWMMDQQTTVSLLARDEKLDQYAEKLIPLAKMKDGVERALLEAPAQKSVQDRMKNWLTDTSYVGYALVSADEIVLSADHDAIVGKPLTGYRKEFFDRVLERGATVSRPYGSNMLLPDEKGELRANVPTMFAAAPLRDEQGKPIAVVALRIRPQDHFTKILQVARFGDTGETYAFDRDGIFLSQSRFDRDLKSIGLLVDRDDIQSILNLSMRDPGVDMTKGKRPEKNRSELPLTYAAQKATAGENGYNADGYRDYRGVQVVGAWRWLDDYDFGVATEVDVDEAFAPVYILHRAFRILMVLLVLCALGIFAAMWYMARQQKALARATYQAKQLGQYSLEQKLGAGGMGTVFQARHAMLRRPTAVKLLDVEKMTDAAIARFEREVQMTSSLSHPNTVVIFDYGRTDTGVFYYAMELLEGLNLEQLITRHGPITEARALFLLKQICGSLAEAHAAGLVHRDIKPANIFLTSRGGLYDFVKVLDFGLVKSTEGRDTLNVTSANALTGTPLYLAPEAVNQPDQVDAHADVYAIGAVAYYLLTGMPVFEGESIMDICMKHVQAVPVPPSQRSGQTFSADLEALILRCLAKAKADRPASAGELLTLLEDCQVEGDWNAKDAADWWGKHSASIRIAVTAGEIDAHAVTKLNQDDGQDRTMIYEKP